MSDPSENSAFSFVDMEHQILNLWEETDAFKQSLEKTKGKKPFIFYDGPPFATGLPHHGHLVASTIKDIVPRYWTMKGRYVLRVLAGTAMVCPLNMKSTNSLVCRPRMPSPSWAWLLQRRVPGHCAALREGMAAYGDPNWPLDRF